MVLLRFLVQHYRQSEYYATELSSEEFTRSDAEAQVQSTSDLTVDPDLESDSAEVNRAVVTDADDDELSS